MAAQAEVQTDMPKSWTAGFGSVFRRWYPKPDQRQFGQNGQCQLSDKYLAANGPPIQRGSEG